MNEQKTVSRPAGETPETLPPDRGPSDIDVQFYIPATSSLLERRPRTLKHGDTFAVFDHYGDVVAAPGSPEGLYHRDTRHLSSLELLVDGRKPLLLSSTLQDDNAVLTVDLVNPDTWHDGQLALSRETIHITRSKFLFRGCCYERLAVHNFDRLPHRLRLGMRFAADFADLFEVRGMRRAHRGTVTIDRPAGDAVTLRYRALDGVECTTRFDFAPTPDAISTQDVRWTLDLDPGERISLFVLVRCGADNDADAGPSLGRGSFFRALREAHRAARKATSRNVVIDSSNAILNRVLCRSVTDLYMLITDTEYGPYPYAGIPWFSTTFGRDGIITALMTLWFDPEIARGVLGFLAATQATEEDPEADAEPGKILHEMRAGEMARLGEVPFGRYYGGVDSTPLFVLLAGRYFRRTGDRATIAALWPNIDAALRWTDTYGDRDGDGFLEYRARAGKGLTNQGWKDSGDSISHADGRLASAGIALCEVQGYVYAARLEAANMARALGRDAQAAALERAAEDLRQRFEMAFWDDALDTYALALDGDHRRCRVRSSNAGQVLFTGIAEPARARRVAATLLSGDLYSGWGIRTLAASAARYNPMSYHNGSVWPHDNALIALGLARYGLKHEVARLFAGLFDAVQYMDLLRLPELFCGFSRRRGRAPTLYPVACAPQAWSTVAPLAFLDACLGLEFDPARREIRFDRPTLPSFIDELRLRRLRLGDAQVDILLRRHKADVSINVLERSGDVRVVLVT